MRVQTYRDAPTRSSITIIREQEQGGKKAGSLKKHSRRLLSLDFTGNFFLLYELVHLNEKKRKGQDLGIKVFQTLDKVPCLIFTLTADIKVENRWDSSWKEGMKLKSVAIDFFLTALSAGCVQLPHLPQTAVGSALIISDRRPGATHQQFIPPD